MHFRQSSPDRIRYTLVRNPGNDRAVCFIEVTDRDLAARIISVGGLLYSSRTTAASAESQFNYASGPDAPPLADGYYVVVVHDGTEYAVFVPRLSRKRGRSG